MAKPVEVLLVDDSSFLRAAISGILAMDRRIVVIGQAANGEEGLALVAALRPNVVVTDLEMPVMDGAEFIELQLARSYLPMIIFSAVRFNSALATRARRAGAVAHVVKPFAMTDVLAQQQVLKAQILAAAG